MAYLIGNKYSVKKKYWLIPSKKNKCLEILDYKHDYVYHTNLVGNQA